MRQTRLGSWLQKGTADQRFAKEFTFYFVISMVVWSFLFYANRLVGFKVFTDAPFVSEDFWVTCACNALGFAMVIVTSRAKVRKNGTMAE
jgi:hypothetical protein